VAEREPHLKADYTSPYFPNVEFTQEDIEANHQGRLTPRQEQIISTAYQTRQRDTFRTAKWFVASFVALLAVGVIIEYSAQPASLDVFIARQGPIFLFVAVMLLGILGVSLILGRGLNTDLRNRRVRVAEGTADVLTKQAYSKGMAYMRYELRLKRGRSTVKLFRLGNPSSLANFEVGQSYRVYYIEYYQLPIILSAEKAK
jgi:hypothetical protein